LIIRNNNYYKIHRKRLCQQYTLKFYNSIKITFFIFKTMKYDELNRIVEDHHNNILDNYEDKIKCIF